MVRLLALPLRALPRTGDANGWRRLAYDRVETSAEEAGRRVPSQACLRCDYTRYSPCQSRCRYRTKDEPVHRDATLAVDQASLFTGGTA